MLSHCFKFVVNARFTSLKCISYRRAHSDSITLDCVELWGMSTRCALCQPITAESSIHGLLHRHLEVSINSRKCVLIWQRSMIEVMRTLASALLDESAENRRCIGAVLLGARPATYIPTPRFDPQGGEQQIRNKLGLGNAYSELPWRRVVVTSSRTQRVFVLVAVEVRGAAKTGSKFTSTVLLNRPIY
jgi:hypothetical protein